MMTLSSILAMITGPQASSAELRQAHAAVDIAGAEASIDRLEERRRALLLRPDSDRAIEQTEAEIHAATRELDRLHAAAKELDKLIVNAEELEKAATIDGKAAEAKRLQRRLLEGFVAFDEAAAKLAEMRQGLEGTTRQLEAANAYLAEHGHGELRALMPTQLLDAQGVSQSDMPRLSEWFMPGYHPLPAGWMGARPKARPFGLAQRLLKEVGRG